MSIQLRDGSTTEDPRLDRLQHFDPKSRGWQVRSLLREMPRRPRRGRSWRPGPITDQGREGACVAHGCHQRYNGAPVVPKPPITDTAVLLDYYHACQRRDIWEGGSYPGASPFYEGTSVLAGMQEGQARGYWDNYFWIGAGSGDVEGDIVETIGWVGTIVFGLPFLRSMFTPRPSGLLEVDWSSGVAGGHCLAENGLWLRTQLRGEPNVGPIAWLPQSWGTEHGVARHGQPGGFVAIRVRDLCDLMEHGGEGAVPVEKRRQ